MRNFYIKKLGSQELGSPKADGTTARGRYIYITKAYDNFFPQLSKTVVNDTVLIPVIPEFSEQKIYSSFVYHNDKHSTAHGTRDEFRFYLNKDVDLNRNYFDVDDIVVFERLDTGTLIPIYFLYKFQPTNPNYSTLNSIITNSPIKGGHALFNEDLGFIPIREINFDEATVIIPEEVKATVNKEQEQILKVEEENIEDTKGANLFNSISFRDFVLLAYQYKCAITGKVIRYNNLLNLEAAHIQPKAHTGTFLPCNGIALCRDMHWAFDKGFFTIDDDFKVVVHEKVQSTILSEYHNKKIFVPTEQYFQPEKKFLSHHRKNVFGIFLHSGSIRSLQ